MVTSICERCRVLEMGQVPTKHPHLNLRITFWLSSTFQGDFALRLFVVVRVSSYAIVDAQQRCALCVVRSSAVTNQNEAEWNLMFDFELYSVPCKIICYLTLLFIINFKTFYKQATILSLLVTKLLLHFLLVGELVKTNGVTERVEESAEAAKMCF